MKTTSHYVNTFVSDNILHIELNRPEKYNVLSSRMFIELTSAFNNAKNTSLSAVLIYGAGNNFCAGADIMELKSARASRKDMELFINSGLDAFSLLKNLAIPSISFVTGFCFAGGLELALNTDIIIASKSAIFSDQHVKFGFIPGWGGASILSSRIGESPALDMILTGRRIDSNEAMRLGLIQNIIDTDSIIGAKKYCESLTRNNNTINTYIKKMVRSSSDTSMTDISNVERTLAIDYLLSDKASEGIAKFEASIRLRK